MSNISGDPLYARWNMMKQRCDNPNNSKYNRYGGRGITIYKEWYDFQTYKEWCLINGYDKNLTLDRIDNDGNYEPNNCRWVNQSIQQNNRSNNRVITYKDKIYTLAELSKEHGLDSDTVSRRLSAGMSVSESVNTPLNNHQVINSSEATSLREECIKRSLNYKTVHMRISRGWSVERALNTPIREGDYK